jgi:AcrR family transcriptional regulator
MIEAPSEGPRWERRKAARPSELVAAALQLFVERGFAATRLEDVAARAGVSKGTLYLYFDNKEELFKAVIREGMLPALAEGEKLLSGFAGSTADLLHEFFAAWWDLVGSKPIGGLPKLIICEAGNFPEPARFYYDEVILRAHRLLRAIVERGQRSGEFIEGDAEILQQIVFAPFLMFTVLRNSLADCAPRTVAADSYLAHAVAFVVRGLRRPGAAPEGGEGEST